MKHIHHYSHVVTGAVFLCFTLSICAGLSRGQSGLPDERSAGIALLQTGDAAGAAKLLKSATKKHKADLTAWYWLGRSLEQQGKYGDARKAYEKAAKLGDTLLMNQIEAAGVENWSTVFSRQKPQVDLAIDAVFRFVTLSPKLSREKRDEWDERRDFLNDFQDVTNVTNLSIYKSSEVTTRARVLAKPEPQYTDEARANQITGTVVLRAIFAADGKVRAIAPIHGLPYGLTLAAIRAARQIRFVPAMNDGKPVSMWMQLEYNFNLY